MGSTTTRLRILHVSDVHLRGPREKERWKRYAVLGKAFDDNIARFRGAGPIDLVFFTGDLANWGMADEYADAKELVERILQGVGVPTERFFVVPGNHDINRNVSPGVWRSVRGALAKTRADEISSWMAGTKVPNAFKKDWRKKILLRQQAFWDWVGGNLGRPDLLPRASPHGALGYRVTLTGILRCPLHVIGLDTAWLAGDDHDKGALALTEDQVMRLSTDEAGRPLPGLRLALQHHPLGDLFDESVVTRRLGDHVDLLFRGHMHEPDAVAIADPDRRLRVLSAGCLYEPDEGIKYRNECHLLELEVADDGTLVAAQLHCRSWSEKGFWYDDNNFFKDAQDGKVPVFQSAPMAAPAAFRISIKGKDNVELSAGLTAATLAGAWDAVPPNSPMHIAVEGNLEDAPGLADALLRVGVHGGLSALYVRDQNSWAERGDRLLQCIGVEVQDWKWTLAPASTGWGILKLHEAPAIAAGALMSLSASSFVSDLNTRMDAWVWGRVKEVVADALEGGTQHTRIEIHESVRKEMAVVWESWKTSLDAKPEASRHFLAAALTTATPLRSDAAAMRLGRRVVERGLLKGILFALAVEVGLSADVKPAASTMPINLVFRTIDAHVVSLELISNRQLHVFPLDLGHEPPFLLLANCHAAADELADARQRIGAPDRGEIRIGAVDLASPFTFTATAKFDRTLGEGLPELRSFLRAQVEDAAARNREQLQRTLDER